MVNLCVSNRQFIKFCYKRVLNGIGSNCWEKNVKHTENTLTKQSKLATPINSLNICESRQNDAQTKPIKQP